jgi:hypothetical protein
VSINKTNKTYKVQRNGLISGLFYTLVGMFDLLDKTGASLQLMKFKSTNIESEWNGAFSDYSKDWTPQLRRQVGSKVKQDGEFFMTFQDFLKNFKYVMWTYKNNFKRCEFHFLQNNYHNSLACQADKFLMMQVNIHKPGKTLFSLHQLDSRHFALPSENVKFSSVRFDSHLKEEKSHCYSYFRVLIARINDLTRPSQPRKMMNMFNSIATVQSIQGEVDNKSNLLM